MIPKILFLSENLQLAGPLLLELWRAHQANKIEIVAVWSNALPSRHAGLGSNASEALRGSKGVTLPDEATNESAIFNGIVIEHFGHLAKELELPYQQMLKINTGAVPAAIAGLEVDYGITMGYGQILKDRPLRAPKKGWVNFHPSLLPEHRGPFPGFWEFRQGATKTGVTLHEMALKADRGPIIAQQEIPITEGSTFRSMIAGQGKVAAEIGSNQLLSYFRNEITPVEQPQGGSYQSQPTPEDFVISAEMGCDQVFSFVRGLRGVAKALVVAGERAFSIDSVASALPQPHDLPPGYAEEIGPGRVVFYAHDGRLELVVQKLDIEVSYQG